MAFKEIFKACVPLEQAQLASSLYHLLCCILVLFLLNENLKYAAAVVSFNAGMPSALWMEMENNRFWGGLRPLFKTPGNQHPGGGTAGAGSRILSGNTRDVGETPPQNNLLPAICVRLKEKLQITAICIWKNERSQHIYRGSLLVESKKKGSNAK